MKTDYSGIKKIIRDRIREKMDFTRDYSDDEVQDLIDDEIMTSEETEQLSVPDKRKICNEIFDSLRRLDILQKYVDDPSVTEIMINGRDRIFVEKDGQISELEECFEDDEKLGDVIQQIVAGCNRAVNEASPIVDARLANGSRVNVVMNPVALNGPIVTIRRFPDKPIDMNRLLELNSLTLEAAGFLSDLVKAKYNIFISGGTGSGKTTFLNVMSGYISQDERVITIEDSAELQIQGIRNLVRLETRSRTTEGAEEISIRDLIRASLRMRPDRVVIGEVRGAEALDMLQAMNTGHDGSMSTGHANSAKDMMSRLENMVLMGADLPLPAIRQQIASGLDLIVHLGRLRDRSRRVQEITEVLGYENGEIRLNQIYEFEEDDYKDGKVIGSLKKKGELQNRNKLCLAGLSCNPMERDDAV